MSKIDMSQLVYDYTDLKDKINDVILKYNFEFNTKEVRDMMAKELSQVLKEEVLDETSDGMVYYSKYYFTVNIDDKKYSLSNYLKLLERIEKIKKLKDKYGQD